MYLLSNKFLVRPRPFDDEFILSYLQRVSEANSYASIDQICSTVFDHRKSLTDIIKGNFDKKLLAQFTDLSISQICDLLTVDEDYYLSSNLIFCIECFKLNKYIKKQFYKKEYICEKHDLPMISRCLFCNRLYSWKVLDSLKCNYCKKPINNEIEQKILKETYVNNVLKFANLVLKYKLYAPMSLSYQFVFYIKRYNYAHNLLLNKNNSFELFIKQFFFNDYIYKREPSKYIDEYIYFLINMKKTISEMTLDEHVIKLEKILKMYFIDDLDSDELESDFNSNFISFNQEDSKKYMFISYLNCQRILGIDLNMVEYFCAKKLLKSCNKYIDLYSLFKLCVDIKLSSTYEDLSENYTYFKDLSKKEMLRILKDLRFGNFILYNFNSLDSLSKVKISNFDLNYGKIDKRALF